MAKNSTLIMIVALATLVASYPFWDLAGSKDRPEAPCPEVKIVKLPEEEKKPEAPPVEKPAITDWEIASNADWAELLPGKWTNEAGATAEFVHERKGSKTPFNVKLGAPNGKKVDWFGCGFYHSSVAYCRDENTEKSQKTLVVIETKEGTDAIRFTAYDGRFKHELARE